VLPAGPEGRVDLPALLDWLGGRGVCSLLVEGGGTVLGSFGDAGLVDRVVAFLAPVLIGGATAPGPLGGRGVARLDEAARLVDVVVELVDGDLMVDGFLRRVPWPEWGGEGQSDVHRDHP